MFKRVSINILTRQFLHFVALAMLLVATWYGWRIIIGSPRPLLFWVTIAIPILHQIFVWISWRTKLKSKAISKSIGFKGYLVIFFVLLIARPVSLLTLAWVDQTSMSLNLISRTSLSILLFVPAIYAMYSVKKYFGFWRAAGADHFDLNFRNIPLVKKGIFKYSNSAMYVFGFLMFWAVAIALDSKVALLSSGFAHAYIWVHYYATEKPDMDYLYQKKID